MRAKLGPAPREGGPIAADDDDGDIPDNAKAAAVAGASVLVAGSAVYLDPDGVGPALAKLRRALA